MTHPGSSLFAVLRARVAGRRSRGSSESRSHAIVLIPNSLKSSLPTGGAAVMMHRWSKVPCGVGSCRMGDTRVRSFVSAQEVAELAGVSRSAVSRTFTDGASVSEATRRKVRQAAEQLGYHVNHLARSLIQEQSGIVCLIVAEIATPYQARMLD